MAESLLTVAAHLSVLIVIEVILHSGTQLLCELIAYSESQQWRHIIASLGAILERCSVGTKWIFQTHKSFFSVRHRCHHVCHYIGSQSCVQHVCLIFCLNLCAELITCTYSKRSFVEIKADDRSKAPTLLIHIKQQRCHLTKHRVVASNNMTAVVAVIIVSTQTYRCWQAVDDFIREVHLTTIYILLTLHVRVERVLAWGDTLFVEQGSHHHVIHRHAFLILHKAAAAHDANHTWYSPLVLVVSSEERWHDRSRGLAIILFV